LAEQGRLKLLGQSLETKYNNVLREIRPKLASVTRTEEVTGQWQKDQTWRGTGRRGCID